MVSPHKPNLRIEDLKNSPELRAQTTLEKLKNIIWETKWETSKGIVIRDQNRNPSTKVVPKNIAEQWELMKLMGPMGLTGLEVLQQVILVGQQAANQKSFGRSEETKKYYKTFVTDELGKKVTLDSLLVHKASDKVIFNKIAESPSIDVPLDSRAQTFVAGLPLIQFKASSLLESWLGKTPSEKFATLIEINKHIRLGAGILQESIQTIFTKLNQLEKISGDLATTKLLRNIVDLMSRATSADEIKLYTNEFMERLNSLAMTVKDAKSMQNQIQLLTQSVGIFEKVKSTIVGTVDEQYSKISNKGLSIVAMHALFQGLHFTPITTVGYDETSIVTSTINTQNLKEEINASQTLNLAPSKTLMEKIEGMKLEVTAVGVGVALMFPPLAPFIAGAKAIVQLQEVVNEAQKKLKETDAAESRMSEYEKYVREYQNSKKYQTSSSSAAFKQLATPSNGAEKIAAANHAGLQEKTEKVPTAKIPLAQKNIEPQKAAPSQEKISSAPKYKKF